MRKKPAVIGHHPDYLELAAELEAKVFSIPEKEWDSLTDIEKWAKNQLFLDKALAEGRTFLLATPLERMRSGSYFEREVQYLLSRGCNLSRGETHWEIKLWVTE